MSAKTKAPPYQPSFDDSDDDCDCPKCPPVGAPAWLATFADIATNLMAFFVLILGFANFDEPSFEKFAGAMREQFSPGGFDGKSGDTIINLAPMPAPDKTDDSEFDDSAPGDGANSAPSDDSARAVAEALRDALAQGSLQVNTGSGTVTVRLPDVQGPEAAIALADAIAAAAGGNVERSDTIGQPLPGKDPALRDTETPPADPAKGQPESTSGNDSAASTVAEVRAKLSAMVMQTVFESQIADGALSVEQRDGKVVVTLGAGGSFESGSADLSDEARTVMARIASATNRPNRTITVTGHTDDVPISGGDFTDNFDLAAARAASVVRELVATDKVDPARISAVSKGEYAPLADNATEEGRAKNRRIEIEIGFESDQP